LAKIEGIELEDNIKSLIEKMNYVEEFLNRRTRGFYGRSRRS